MFFSSKKIFEDTIYGLKNEKTIDMNNFVIFLVNHNNLPKFFKF